VNPAQAVRPTYLPVHYGDPGNPPRVLCASADLSTPVSRDWAVVTCPGCLGIGGLRGSPTARTRLAALAGEISEG